jgi:hypothetical protein
LRIPFFCFKHQQKVVQAHECKTSKRQQKEQEWFICFCLFASVALVRCGIRRTLEENFGDQREH